MVEDIAELTLAQQVDKNTGDIVHLHTHLGRCPINTKTVQFYADEMERNRKNFQELSFKVHPLIDKFKDLEDTLRKDIKEVWEQQNKTNELMGDLIEKIKDVLEHV